MIISFARNAIPIGYPKDLSIATTGTGSKSFGKLILAYIDVGDGCWRRNMLATTLRC